MVGPQVVRQLLARPPRSGPVESLTPREREVLGLMAEGCTNAVIARRLVVTEEAVERHAQRIFATLGLHGDEGRHRRVGAVLTFLQA